MAQQKVYVEFPDGTTKTYRYAEAVGIVEPGILRIDAPKELQGKGVAFVWLPATRNIEISDELIQEPRPAKLIQPGVA